MALIKCKECGNEVSSKAESCPKCGYNVASNEWTTFRKIKYAFFIGLMILINQTCKTCNEAFDKHSSEKSDPQPVPNSNVPAPPSREITPEPSPSPSASIEPGSQWEYSQNEDDMGNGKSYLARIKSLNTVNFSFPYKGEQYGSLLIRNHPRYGKDILFSIEKGQILCSSYNGCNVLIRFDDEKAQRYSANGTADNSTETVFISNYSKFIGKLQKAKRLRLSVDVYQQGSPVFEFDVSGFDVNKYKPKKDN